MQDFRKGGGGGGVQLIKGMSVTNIRAKDMEALIIAKYLNIKTIQSCIVACMRMCWNEM